MPRWFKKTFTALAAFCGALACLGVLADDKPKRDRTLFAEGRHVFEANCVICHGRRGDGKGEMALGLYPQPRDFRTGVFKYRSTPAGKLPTDADLARIIRTGLSDTAMPMFNHLSERELEAVIDYVKSYSSKWRKPEHHGEPIEIPPSPAWLDQPALAREHAARGKALFQTACAACHGPDGSGAGTAAELKDDWGTPSIPPDLRKPYIRIGRTPGDIYQMLVTGVNGTPMPSFQDTTTAEERWELVAYILQLRREQAEQASDDPTRR